MKRANYALFYTSLYKGARSSPEFGIHRGPEINPPKEWL